MFAQQPCGCPVERYKYPYKCTAHAAVDGRLRLPGVRADTWYRENTCPFCGRVNPAGLACDSSDLCALCGVRVCWGGHNRAVYALAVICPTQIHPRTKVGRALLKSLGALGATGE